MCEGSGVTNVVIMSQPNLDPSAEHPSRHLGASLSADEFKALFRGHPGGVAVITADAGEGPVALTATSVASVSAEPPLLIFSVSAQSSASAVLASAETVVVHLLDADDLALAKLGATSGVDRFADTSAWSRLTTGEPVYRGVRAWVRCAVVSRMDAGGSVVIAGHALQSHVERDVEPGGHGDALVYHNRTWHRLNEHSALEG
ncbi:NADH-FMN oxidoreductase RutF, flavin reductase (DIM6/NTAB) family [Microbacterium sp. cf332]|nr:NADH-FMN oxidoreductase RutF, flavin reductase (DIM6/NTAB) family [Microbacterium sp. cf332]